MLIQVIQEKYLVKEISDKHHTLAYSCSSASSRMIQHFPVLILTGLMLTLPILINKGSTHMSFSFRASFNRGGRSLTRRVKAAPRVNAGQCSFIYPHQRVTLQMGYSHIMVEYSSAAATKFIITTI